MVRMNAVNTEPVMESGPNKETFEAFFRHSYVRLCRALLLLTSDPGEAEDLAQEALARVYERWDRVRRMESPDGYLYRTAMNLNRKRLRRLAIRTRRAADQPLPPDDLASAEERVDLLRIIASLPRGQREALVLVEWMGFEAEEAASILRITPTTVRTRVHRARAALRPKERVDE
jgi:RNA polymerase sigma-70 factor, ECF subfamily